MTTPQGMLATQPDAKPVYACYQCRHQFNWQVEPTNCPGCGGEVAILISRRSRQAAAPQGREALIEQCANVEVRGDVETEAEASNEFQEGYAVGYQDTVYRFREAIRTLALTPADGAGEVPDGATHMRRPEYITAWLFDRQSTMPIWLIEKYKSDPLPNEKIGHYATAIDGEFWRWLDPAKFEEMFVALAQAQEPGEDKR